MQGVGAAFSTTLAGFIIVNGGYSVAFLALAAIALAALLISLFFMPETKSAEMQSAAEEVRRSSAAPSAGAVR